MASSAAHRTLAIDCATEACSVALSEDGTVVASDYRVLGRGHAEHLVPMIAALPGRGRAGRILVSLGPGSFTGVRIGIAAARALGFAWGATVLGYPTLALIAAMALRRHPGASGVTVCTSGGHGEWFVQDFGPDGSEHGSLASLAPGIAGKRTLGKIVAGSEACALVTLAGDSRPALDLRPDAAFAHELAPFLLTGELVPIYGRAPDARLPA
jgi:tRNA threonylcarbamoyladenosine biosynthesis protein TsaB